MTNFNDISSPVFNTTLRSKECEDMAEKVFWAKENTIKTIIKTLWRTPLHLQ